MWMSIFSALTPVACICAVNFKGRRSIFNWKQTLFCCQQTSHRATFTAHTLNKWTKMPTKQKEH